MPGSKRLSWISALIACATPLLWSPSASAAAPLPGFARAGVGVQRTYEQRFQRGLSAPVIGRTSRELSRTPRLTGTAGLGRALTYSVERLRSYGLHVSTPTYGVYASHPVDISVMMTAPSTRRLAGREPGFDDVVAAYNAYSPPGTVSGGVVYANRARPEDFAMLARLGVDVRGRIVLVRYGGSYRGAKVSQAEQRGAAGVLLYSDPEDDGFARGPVYPDGPWRPVDGIQRGTVEYLFRYPGDPLTPGAPSVPDARRIAPADAKNLPRIPAAPISARDAQALLGALGGPPAPTSFQGALPITYRLGPGATEVRIDVDIAYEQTPVRNVLATIRGATRPRERVIVGGHIDSWAYGAGDNASGWATIMEIGRSLGRLLDRGLRPDRTIVLAGWDGEEQGLLGSTEWVEQFQRDLRRNAVAYLNLSQVGGTRFYASGVPALDDALIAATKAVRDPRTGKSVYEVWRDYENRDLRLGRLGSGSDYTAFLDRAGVPSLDASFGAPAGPGTYHSAYDGSDNMERHLDPGYLGHLGSARVAGVTALRLANADVLPFRYSAYAAAVASYVRELQVRTPVELGSLLTAVREWQEACKRLEAHAAAVLHARGAHSRAFDRVNAVLMREERALSPSRGLPGRPWFRHRVYAPGLDSGYDVAYLPGLRDAIDHGADGTLRGQRDRLLDSLRAATHLARAG